MDTFAERRRRLAEAVGRGVIALLGHGRSAGQSGFTGFRQESNFYYLTAHSEPGAALLIAPGRRTAPYREVLFLPRRNAQAERWSGPFLGPDDAECLGFQDVRDVDELAHSLGSLLKDRTNLMGLRPKAGPGSEALGQAAALDRLREISGNRDVRDIRSELASMRAIKSSTEIALLRKAVNATVSAFRAAWSATRPGASERSAVAEFVGAAFRAGCERLAFPPMAGSGRNATILHYSRNRSAMQDGEMLLVDAGGEYSRYCADLARTVPVGGKFSARQRQFYELVLGAQRAVITAARPGVALGGRGPRTLESIAERHLRAGAPRGIETDLPHAIGHHVGLDVHDPAPPRTNLRKGMVLAIEPGIYLPQEGLGIRVEDMIEITSDGCRVMSDGLPRSIEGVETALNAEASA